MTGLISINHRLAGVDERSAFALSEGEASMLVEDWIACGLLTGAVVLSTCNRVEIYYSAEDGCASASERRLIDSFLRNLELSPRYAQYLECKRDEDVYRHLFRLAAGLESIVVGETQILGQLKEAYRMASLAGHCPGSMARLFHRAFEVAKRVRSEYLVSATPHSAGSAAVEQMLRILPQPRQTLIVGAGLIADTVCEHLRHHGISNIVVYNRTRERAERFASQHPELRIACEGELTRELLDAEAVLVATSAPSPIIKAEDFAPEGPHPTLFIDLAVPRNIAPEVGDIEGVTLISIDELTELGASLDLVQLEQIDSIIEEYILLHKQWVEGAQLREAIGSIQQTASRLLDKELSLLPSQLSPEERELIKQWDEHLRTTYTTAIVAALREVSDEGRKRKYPEALKAVFDHIQNKLHD